MTSTSTTPATHRTDARSRSGVLLAAAVGFALVYVANDFVVPNLASAPLPLPDAPAEEAKAWFADNGVATATTGVVQALSVGCLALFVLTLRRVTSRLDAAGRATPWGLASVWSMLVASIIAWVLAAAAGTASVEAVGALRTANFIAGGTAHVVLLGVFVLLAGRIPNTTKPIRVLSIAAAVPAVLSLSSLVVFEGAALILLGRLLCMVWAICAAVSLRRRIGKGEVV